MNYSVVQTLSVLGFAGRCTFMYVLSTEQKYYNNPRFSGFVHKFVYWHTLFGIDRSSAHGKTEHTKISQKNITEQT
ncbi:hypothetical protein McpSp1_15600 [Methanocorpusculaceae archaeon Sp1]|nr:hypothetical protein [Methanocorpusculaceae archaeon Sp1]